jgi:hypothetical protein
MSYVASPRRTRRMQAKRVQIDAMRALPVRERRPLRVRVARAAEGGVLLAVCDSGVSIERPEAIRVFVL